MEPKASILALDLEGTLISNAMSQIPRPNLFEFLTSCNSLFPRIVMFTTVNETKFRKIAALLVSEGFAPKWFEDIEYVHWQGHTKNLEFVPDSRIEEILLVDDFDQYVHVGQETRWVQIECFEYPYELTDTGLVHALKTLENRLSVAIDDECRRQSLLLQGDPQEVDTLAWLAAAADTDGWENET
jgi:hypothetical protein